MKWLWVAIILASGIVCHLDSPKSHIETAVKNAEVPCYTPLDDYNHVSLIAANRKEGGKKCNLSTE